MNATLRLTGLVSERPAEVETVYRELREVLAENDRLIERNQVLKRRLNKALERVAALEAGRAPGPIQPVLALGRLRLNYELRMLSLNGRSTHFTARGGVVLAYLMSRPNQVIPTRTLARVLELPSEGNAVRTLLWRLRQTVAEIGAEPYLRSYGRSWSGGGYWMTDPEQGSPS